MLAGTCQFVFTCFQTHISVFLLDLEGTISPWNLNLPFFSIKKIKKLRAKVKFTALFKNMRPNAMNHETQKHTNRSKSTNHKSL